MIFCWGKGMSFSRRPSINRCSGPGGDWTGQRTHARLVDTGDTDDAFGPQGGLVAEDVSKPLSFRPVAVAAAVDRRQDGPRAGTHIGAQGGLQLGRQGAAAGHVPLPNGAQRKPHGATLSPVPVPRKRSAPARVDRARVAPSVNKL